MRGTRVKQLRKEFYPVYMRLRDRYGRGLKSFKSLFRLVKKGYNAGITQAD